MRLINKMEQVANNVLKLIAFKLDTFIQHGMDAINKGFTTIYGFFIMISSLIVAMSNIQLGLSTLLLAILLDLITGVIASWVEFKKSKEELKPPYFIESAKLRLSLLKVVIYLSVILLSYIITIIFIDGRFSVPASSKNLTLAEVVVGFCIFIEFWSLLENAKRAGFDIKSKLIDIGKSIKEVIKALKP